MAPTSNTVDKARSLIEERLAEIDQERKALEEALRGLGGIGAGKRGPGRPRGSVSGSRSGSSGSRRRRRRKGGTRGEQEAGAAGGAREAPAASRPRS